MLRRRASRRAPKRCELNTRVMTPSAAAQNAAPTALWTAPYRATVQELSIRALNRLTRAGSTTCQRARPAFRSLQAGHRFRVGEHIRAAFAASQRSSAPGGEVKRKSRRLLQPTAGNAHGSRVALVALDRHIAPKLGLCKGATGTLLGFVYDASEGDCSPSLSVEDAARAESQPPLPIAIVNVDERW